jgi:hypothetical protein
LADLIDEATQSIDRIGEEITELRRETFPESFELWSKTQGVLDREMAILEDLKNTTLQTPRVQCEGVKILVARFLEEEAPPRGTLNHFRNLTEYNIGTFKDFHIEANERSLVDLSNLLVQQGEELSVERCKELSEEWANISAGLFSELKGALDQFPERMLSPKIKDKIKEREQLILHRRKWTRVQEIVLEMKKAASSRHLSYISSTHREIEMTLFLGKRSVALQILGVETSPAAAYLESLSRTFESSFKSAERALGEITKTLDNEGVAERFLREQVCEKSDRAWSSWYDALVHVKNMVNFCAEFKGSVMEYSQVRGRCFDSKGGPSKRLSKLQEEIFKIKPRIDEAIEWMQNNSCPEFQK